jgi:hypothetical protein
MEHWLSFRFYPLADGLFLYSSWHFELKALCVVEGFIEINDTVCVVWSP